MDMRRLAAVMAILALLALVQPPRSAHADTGEALMWAGVGVAAYLGLIIGGTLLTTRTPNPEPMNLQPGSLPAPEASHRGVRRAPHCARPAALPALLCW